MAENTNNSESSIEEQQSLLERSNKNKSDLTDEEIVKRNNSKLGSFPQYLCVTIFLVVIIVCIVDFKEVMKQFERFTDWVRVNPYESILAIILLYMFSILFTLPTTATHIMLGYTYSQVFHSEYTAFLFVIPIIFTGCLLGALCAFMMSRYLFRDAVKQQIAQSPWLSRNFQAIDEIIAVQGATIVALLRLTFTPFGLSSYILGVTSISPLYFLLGSCSYLLNFPMQVFIGCSFYGIKASSENQSTPSDNKQVQNTVLIVEIAVTVLITLVMGYFANSMVQEKLEEYNRRDEQKSNKDTDSVGDKKAASNSSKNGNDQESTTDKITSNRPNSIV